MVATWIAYTETSVTRLHRYKTANVPPTPAIAISKGSPAATIPPKTSSKRSSTIGVVNSSAR